MPQDEAYWARGVCDGGWQGGGQDNGQGNGQGGGQGGGRYTQLHPPQHSHFAPAQPNGQLLVELPPI